MNTKEQYIEAYRIIRSTKYEKPGDGPRSYYKAYQYAKRIFGETIATAAYNSEIDKQNHKYQK